jgi:amino acid transporter
MSDGDALERELGLLSAFSIGVGVMIGAGIFVLPGAAADTAGPAATVGFVLAGVIAGFTALSITELGTAMPKAGGAYYYVTDALGPLFGSIAGWGNWVGLAAAVAFYLVGFGSYVSVFVPVPAVGVAGFVISPSQVVALLAVLFFTAVNYVGTEETGSLQTVIVVTLVAVIAGFVLVGAPRVDPANLRPFAPEATGGWGAVFPTAALVFVTYLGFAQINTVAEEVENPRWTLPVAVLGSLVFVTLLYAVVMTVVLGAVPYQDVAAFGDTAMVAVAERLFGPVGLVVMTVAGLLATASSANASLLASSRINFAMARDRIISPELSAVHPHYGTPSRAILITAGMAVAFVLHGDIEVLAKAGSVLHLIVYGMLNGALVVYREADVADYDPDFETPLYPLVPVLGIASSFGLVAFMAPLEIALSALFVVFGGVWYAVYARRHATKSGVLAEYLAS